MAFSRNRRWIASAAAAEGIVAAQPASRCERGGVGEVGEDDPEEPEREVRHLVGSTSPSVGRDWPMIAEPVAVERRQPADDQRPARCWLSSSSARWSSRRQVWDAARGA